MGRRVAHHQFPQSPSMVNFPCCYGNNSLAAHLGRGWLPEGMGSAQLRPRHPLYLLWKLGTNER